MSVNVVNAVIERLKTQVPALHGRVQKAVDLAAMIDKGILPMQMPGAFVLWAGDRPSPNDMTGAVRQRVSETVSVVIVNRLAGDNTGAKASDGADEISDAAIAALVGWSASDELDPFEYQRGVLIGMQAGCVFVQIDVLTRRLLRVV
jgi:hypothetical protein